METALIEDLPPRADLKNIRIGDELGAGGQGKVFNVHDPLIDGKPTALKLYSQKALENLNAATLANFVSFGRQLPRPDMNWLYDNYAWPASVVVKGDQTCGFLMLKASPDYSFDFLTQAKGPRPRLSHVAYLLNDDDYTWDMGLWVTDLDRLIILKTVATSLRRLHGMDIAFGDLSPKNVLFRLHPDPRSFFIDCDAVRLKDETALEQVETVDWKAPDDEPMATRATDSYKFGLLAIRLFARDQTTRDTSAIARLSPKLGELARNSLNANPDRRPTPGQWVDVIQRIPRQSVPNPAPPPPGTTANGSVSGGPVPSGGPQPSPSPLGPPSPLRKPAALLALGAGLVALILIFLFVILPALTGSSPPVRAATDPVAKQEAMTINTLLDQNAASQVKLEYAMNHIFACSDVAGNDSQVNMVVGQGTSELSEASGLPVAALANGASMKSYLVEVLRISLHADEDYLTWANGVMAHGCNAQNLWAPAYANGYAQTQHVVAAKLNFLPLWNNVAGMYGFPIRSQSDI
jgi:hypothetical protein